MRIPRRRSQRKLARYRTRKFFPQGEQEPELLVERRDRAAPGGDSQEEEISTES